jgi:hypothetical protein
MSLKALMFMVYRIRNSVPVPVPYGATVLEEPWPPSRQISIRLFFEPSLSSH